MHKWQHHAKQRVLLEFSSLQQRSPDGIYCSLKPRDFSLWSCVLFVRKGPYAPAILRFEIAFPSIYPKAPPVIRFTTDIFHPLVTPLMTYTCSSSTQSNDNIHVSAEEYLPPGGFSLLHGFPLWFEKQESSSASSMPSSQISCGLCQHQRQSHEIQGVDKLASGSTSNDSSEHTCSPRRRDRAHTLETCGSVKAHVGIITVLNYVKKAFDDAELLDTIPLNSAANAGAWKAWRAHRKDILDTSTESRGSLAPRNGRDLRNTKDEGTLLQTPSHSDDWNWDGVWRDRVQTSIIASTSEPVLYGASGGDDPVRFVEIDDELARIVRTSALLF